MWLLDMRFFRITSSLHDCNRVNCQADVDRVEILPSLLPIIMISYADATLVGELLSISV